MAAMAAALLVLLLAAPAVHGAQYTVGDNAGWNSGVDYTGWVSDKTFTVGDTLGKISFSSNIMMVITFNTGIITSKILIYHFFIKKIVSFFISTRLNLSI